MTVATQTFINEIDTLAEKRKNEILAAEDSLAISGKTYYVSNDGDDKNDGLSPDTPWKTLDRVSNADLAFGDGVLFKRGDLFRGSINTKAGVSYGAYGNGDKPKFYGGDRPLNDPKLWVEVDPEHHIWKWQEKILDVGTLVFDEGKAHSVKLIPSYINGRFVCRNDESKIFDMKEEMVRDLDLYWHFEDKFSTSPSKGESFPIPDLHDTLYGGDLYLRCDKGNPATVYSSIEPVAKRHMFYVSTNDNVTIDNVCIKYVGQHAIGAGTVSGLHVSNCEIGWIGGSIQHYLGTDPNYPQGGRGTVTRYGNAVEIYGGCKDYRVSNCYIYQVYDAGITHQVTTNGKKYAMEDVLYENNLIEYCVYGIEYFLDINLEDDGSYMKGVEMKGNIIRHSGYGWGQQRHNTHTPAHIKGWSYHNRASDYSIHDNIFDRAAYRMLHLVAKDEASLPEMYNNTYIQHDGGMLGQYGANNVAEPEILTFDDSVEEKIEKTFGDKNAKVYIIK